MEPIRLTLDFFRVSLMSELQYRANFVVQLVRSFCALITGLAGLAIVFSYTSTLAGWSYPELLAVMGVHLVMGGLIRSIIQPNMERILDDVQQGTLDFVLTKPVDSQILVSVRELQIWQATDAVLGAVVLGIALSQMQTAIGAAQALSFAVALLLGAVIIYSFYLILTTGAFWVIRMDNVLALFNGVYQAGRWPVSVYPDWMQTGLTVLVPVAFAVTVPAQALTQRLTPEVLAGSSVFATLLFVLSRWIWGIGLRHYSGASA